MSHESLRLADSLCRGFEQQTTRLLEVLRGLREAREAGLNLEAKESAEVQDYDSRVNACLVQIEEIDARAEARRFAKDNKEASRAEEKNMVLEIERLRKIVRKHEEDRDQLQFSLTQKKQKQHEMVMSRQALIESRKNLKQENEQLRADIKALEKDLQEKTGSIHCEMFDNTKNTQILRDGKQDFRKRLLEASTLERKFSKAQENLGKDAKKLEGRKSRLNTLREVNKTLRRRLQTKKELEQRYVELTEQSLNLQFLISEAMKELASKYDIHSDEIEEVQPADFVSSPTEIITYQSRKIDSLNNTIRGQNISNTKRKYGTLVYS